LAASTRVFGKPRWIAQPAKLVRPGVCTDERSEELKTDSLRASIGCMPGMIYRVVGVAMIAATLILSGCNFGGDNAGDVSGTGETGQSSLEHRIPESQKTGTVTGEPGPETRRY
jgi:hypothetical protein